MNIKQNSSGSKKLTSLIHKFCLKFIDQLLISLGSIKEIPYQLANIKIIFFYFQGQGQRSKVMALDYMGSLIMSLVLVVFL